VGWRIDDLEGAVTALEHSISAAMSAAAGKPKRRKEVAGGIGRRAGAELCEAMGPGDCKWCARRGEEAAASDERLRAARLAALGAKNDAARRMRRDEARPRLSLLALRCTTPGHPSLDISLDRMSGCLIMLAGGTNRQC
jgi:hypothetical protein